MSKIIKKKIKFKIIPIFIFILLSVSLYYGIKYLSDTKIKNIYILGNNLLSDQEIIELAGIENYPSFYKTLSKNMKKGIKKSPYVKSVSISKKFFNVLEINVVEYTPLFIMNNELILENEDKVPVKDIKVPILVSMVQDEPFSKLVKGFLKVKLNIRNNVSEIIYAPTAYDQTRFLLYMDDGNHVYVNTGKMENLNYYDEIYPTLNNKKGTLYLDSGNHFEVFK